MRHSIAFAALVCISCGKGGDTGLSERARSFCHDLATELRSAASEYGSYAANLRGDGTSAAKEREALALTYGATPRERGIAGVRLHSDLQFCVHNRRADATKLDALSGRVTTESGRFRSTDAPVDVASAIDALAKTATEIDQLPVRE